jgi:hypothetical protein
VIGNAVVGGFGEMVDPSGRLDGWEHPTLLRRVGHPGVAGTEDTARPSLQLRSG